MMTPEKLLRRALVAGAELEIDGRVMNASRQRVKPAPVREVPKPAAAPVPVAEPPKPAGISREEVQAMLDARDALWQMIFADLSERINAPKPAPKLAHAVSFDYDERGMIKRANIIHKE